MDLKKKQMRKISIKLGVKDAGLVTMQFTASPDTANLFRSIVRQCKISELVEVEYRSEDDGALKLCKVFSFMKSSLMYYEIEDVGEDDSFCHLHLRHYQMTKAIRGAINE